MKDTARERVGCKWPPRPVIQTGRSGGHWEGLEGWGGPEAECPTAPVPRGADDKEKLHGSGLAHRRPDTMSKPGVAGASSGLWGRRGP